MVSAKKIYVRGGAHLWVSTLLYSRGILTSSRIWEEFQRDKTVDPELITSKSFLKKHILTQMKVMGKITPDRAPEKPEYKISGWKLVPNKAFANVAPDILNNKILMIQLKPSILSQLSPPPIIKRKDYIDYLVKNDIQVETVQTSNSKTI